MAYHEEELLEPLARKARFSQGIKHLTTSKPIILADLGCGPRIRFYYFAKEHGIHFKNYIAVDPLIHSSIQNIKPDDEIKLVKSALDKTIDLPNNSVDYVVAFAFLEHIDNPFAILKDSIRILKPGGAAIFTTPTLRAKIVLEFLSFKLGLISKREIQEHKTYFVKESLQNGVKDIGNIQTYHQYFELGMNNIFVVKKT